MIHKDSVFHSEGPCLTMEEMTGYLQGHLTPEQHRRVELHLADCELCTEAMEGLEWMPDSTRFPGLIEATNAAIDSLPDQPGEAKIRVLFPWKMAAAIALILVSTLVLWLVIPKQSGQELFTSQYKPYPAPSDTLAPATEPELAREFLKEQDAPSSPAAEAHSKKELSQENVQERIPPSPSIPAEETTPGRLKDADLAVDTKEKESRTVQQELSKSENSADANKAVAGAPESVQRSEQAEAVAEDEPQATAFSARSKTTLPAASSAKSNEPARTSFQLGMLAYKNEKYENAIRYFEMKDNPPEASFFAGVSYLSLENPHLAIQKLDAYLAGEHTSYQEAAWWYKALSLIKTGDKQAARTCLARVVTFKGEFEQKATRLLRKM